MAGTLRTTRLAASTPIHNDDGGNDDRRGFLTITYPSRGHIIDAAPLPAPFRGRGRFWTPTPCLRRFSGCSARACWRVCFEICRAWNVGDAAGGAGAGVLPHVAAIWNRRFYRRALNARRHGRHASARHIRRQQRILAFGHPFFQGGSCSARPVAEVHTISRRRAFV